MCATCSQLNARGISKRSTGESLQHSDQERGIKDWLSVSAYLINQHKHQSFLIINQVLNLLEHPSYQLAALKPKHSY